MTETEEKRLKVGIPRETIVVERIWNKWPDGFAIKMPTTEKAGEFVILDFKRMSCVTDQYVTRSKNVSVTQYVSIKSALERTLGPQGWAVSQRSFIAGTRSLKEQDLPSRYRIH
jgi:hypothetical protein